MLAVVAALGDVAGAYVLPMLFSLKLIPSKMPRAEVLAVKWVLLPVTMAMTCLGLWSSISVLIDQCRRGPPQ